MSKSVFLMVTSAFMVGGAIAKAGEIVEVSNAEAKDLLNRGKAKLATIDAAQLEDAVEVQGEKDANKPDSDGADVAAEQEAAPEAQQAADGDAAPEGQQEEAAEVKPEGAQEAAPEAAATEAKPAKPTKKGK